MDVYKKPYLTLFNAATKAIEQLEDHQYQLALTTLEMAQREAEELCVSGTGPL